MRSYYDSWTYTMVKDGPGMIPDEVQMALKTAACDLELEKKSALLFKTKVFDGMITTDWETRRIGTLAGILFKSEINEGGKTYFVNFLLNAADLARGAAVLKRYFRRNGGMQIVGPRARMPLPELYEFRNLSVAGGGRTIN